MAEASAATTIHEMPHVSCIVVAALASTMSLFAFLDSFEM